MTTQNIHFLSWRYNRVRLYIFILFSKSYLICTNCLSISRATRWRSGVEALL